MILHSCYIRIRKRLKIQYFQFKCCGVNSFKDWHQNEATFSKNDMDKSDDADRRFNKPEGCCRNKKGNIAMPEEEVEVT